MGQRRSDRARSAQTRQRRADRNGAGMGRGRLRGRSLLLPHFPMLFLMGRLLVMGRRLVPGLVRGRGLGFFSRGPPNGRRMARHSGLGGFGAWPLRFSCPRGAHTHR